MAEDQAVYGTASVEPDPCCDAFGRARLATAILWRATRPAGYVIIGGYGGVVRIQHCPFCGAALPAPWDAELVRRAGGLTDQAGCRGFESRLPLQPSSSDSLTGW